MGRPESQILQFGGTVWEVGKAITNAVLARGGSDDDVRKILRKRTGAVDFIADHLVEKPTKPVAAPTNWWAQLFGLAVEAGRFTGFCNTDVTGEHFKYVPGDLDDVEEIEVPIDRDMSTADVRALIDSKGLEPANAFRLLRWWIRHPERQKDCVVAALGQEHNGYVVYVYGHGGRRELVLDHVGSDWDPGYSFLAVRKVSGT